MSVQENPSGKTNSPRNKELNTPTVQEAAQCRRIESMTRRPGEGVVITTEWET